MEQKTEKDEEERETEEEKDHACSIVLKRMNIVILTSPTKGNLSLDNFTWNVFLNIQEEAIPIYRAFSKLREKLHYKS